MAQGPDEELAFHEDDLGEVSAILDDLRRAGKGWVNLLPHLEPDQEPPRRNLFAAIFSGRGPDVPVATWAPGDVGEPVSIGLQHGGGPRALQTLAANGLERPAGWQRVADHPKRGLVLTVPAECDAEQVAWWLLSAAHILTPASLGGNWVARVYQG